MRDSEIGKRLLISLLLALFVAAIIYGMWLLCNYVMQTIVKGIIFIVFVLGVAI